MSRGNPIEPSDAFAALLGIVLGEEPLPGILDRLVQIACQVLPVEVEASITLLDRDDATTVASSHAVAVRLDGRQYDDKRGPCLEAAATGERILIRDMRSDVRWPRFSAAATEAGVLCSLSIPLPVQRQGPGALNFYAASPDAFGEDAIELAETFGAHVAVAVANAQLYETTATLAEQMKQAMATRAVIEQAKGIVMRDRGCSADEAFEALALLSQQTHTKLRDVAQKLVDQVSQAPGDAQRGTTP
jgi:GAF domain-containing protein